MKTLDIVIVNWNAGDLLRRCLSSVAGAEWSGLELRSVVVVDNGSRDSSLENLTAKLPMTVLRNDVNRGFAAASNQGARLGSADYLLFLNPDTEIGQDAVLRAVNLMEENREAGICGVRMIGPGGETDRSCARFPRPLHFLCKAFGLDRIAPNALTSFVMREWDHQSNTWVDHVIGAFYLVRRKLWNELGGFDERFFVYLEDLDFSLRARRKGWRTYFLADAFVMHVGGGTSEAIKAQRLAYSLQSRLEYARKHFSRPGYAIVLLATWLLEPIARTANQLFRGDWRGLDETWTGYRLLRKADRRQTSEEAPSGSIDER